MKIKKISIKINFNTGFKINLTKKYKKLVEMAILNGLKLKETFF